MQYVSWLGKLVQGDLGQSIFMNKPVLAARMAERHGVKLLATVPYTAQVTWGIANAQFSADAKTRRIAQQTINVEAPAAGQLNLRIEIAEGASNVENRAPVIAGTYVDTVRIFLEPR